MKKLKTLLLVLFVGNLAANETVLKPVEKKIFVNGKEAVVYSIEGYYGKKGDDFNIRLDNGLNVPTSIHWHGLILPNKDDGVAFVTQLPIYPKESYPYKFPLVQSGTFFLHSHYGLQEQKLLAAPLILSDPEDEKMDEAIILLADFTFTSPEEIYRNLRCPKMKMKGEDIVDVDYDAFLANHTTLDNPDRILVQEGQKIRLRIINAASSTNFFLNLGELVGEAIAVDGNRIHPVKDSQFELAVAQRIDVVVTIPHAGAYPILAQGEGTDKQAGVVLTTDNANSPVLNQKAGKKAGRLTNAQEAIWRAVHPLKKKPFDRKVEVVLGGNMANYSWTMNGQSWPEVSPIEIKPGERVQIILKNETPMSHPMHLHGHVFQVTGINRNAFEGAMRDTVLVTPNSTLTIEFDANNPGVWPFHCHLLYHLEAGMFTVVKY